jgi:hypothetical protein
MLRILAITAILIIISASPMYSVDLPERPEVIFRDGPPHMIPIVKENTEFVLMAINRFYTNKTPFPSGAPGRIFREEDGQNGLNELLVLAQQTGMFITSEVFEPVILELIDGSLEVRRLFVELDAENVLANEVTQELVLAYSAEGILIGARFAMERERFDNIINSSNSLQDEFRRKQIVNYLERFRTAYNRKDILFIEQQFSDDALIITGTRIQSVRSEDVPLDNSLGQSEQFRLIRQTKAEYIKRLRDEVFAANAFINVEFSDIEIYRHEVYEEVYGINLVQRWDSSRYSDDGYLFLMIDYEDELRPKIYVRAWQREPFEDGRIIAMDMFTLIK